MEAKTQSNQELLLTEQTVQTFSGLLAVDMPTPGGGTSAAMAGLLGASLTRMVAGITAKKAGDPALRERMEETLRRVEPLRRAFLCFIDEDSAAYNRFSAIRAMPQKTPEALQAALQACVLSPFQILTTALDCLFLATDLAKEYYLDTASDLGLAAQNLKLAAQGARLTILINLKRITNRDFVNRYREESERLLSHAESLADEIYGKVTTYLEGGKERPATDEPDRHTCSCDSC